MAADKSSPILIIGAGTFGLSTALHLAETGYTDITVLEKDTQIPSRFSAGYDLNKIIRAEYADPFYTTLSVEAIKQWQTNPLYTPHYHETGYLNVCSAAAPQATIDGLVKYRESLEQHPSFKGKVRSIKGHEEVKGLVKQFSGPVNGWEGYYNTMAGYAHSKNAMGAVHKACLKTGRVKFLTGTEGEVECLIYAEGGASSSSRATTEPRRGTEQQRKCVGAITKDGKIHRAVRTVVTAGAGVVGLMPQQVGRQLGIAARCWGVVHIQLSPEEAAALRGIPVTMVRDLAFFFEPDHETNKFKFCHMGGGYSLQQPPTDLRDSQFVPEIDVQHIRRLLKEVLPHLADRPLVDAHLCWIADSATSDFVLDYVPQTDKSLIVATGDSGHGFKMLPVFGGWVGNLLERGQQSTEKWQWKDVDVGTGDLHEVKNWRHGGGKNLSDLVRAKL